MQQFIRIAVNQQHSLCEGHSGPCDASFMISPPSDITRVAFRIILDLQDHKCCFSGETSWELKLNEGLTHGNI